MLLSAQNISKTHGVRLLFADVSLSIAEGERVGLIGANGSGKSTLLKILAGEETPDSGGVMSRKGAQIVYVSQQDVFDEGLTARQIAVRVAMDASGVHDEHEAETLAGVLLDRLGFDERHAGARADGLSGGWRKRLAFVRALASCGGEPDLLLLDEPTNHLDLEGIRGLEELLKPSVRRGALSVVVVTHDRAFLENIATRVVELGSAYPQGTLDVDGGYGEFLRRRGEVLSAQAKAEQALANQVRRDLAWLSRGPQGRGTKAKGRINASHERIADLSELKTRNAAATAARARVDFNATGRKTRKFIEAIGITKGFGGPARTLFKDLDLELGAGDCLGLLGPNGSGKTTLIRVLTGEIRPDAGTVKLSDPSPRVVVFSQHRREFAPGTLLRGALCERGDQVRFRGEAMHITAWSRRFLFRDAQLEQPIGSLSGGELARVHIARIMLEPADVLVLDEPTNDLDIPTLEVMEESLDDFPGALVLVTHDRAMLERLATRVLSIDGRGGARLVASVDQALAAQRVAQTTVDAAAPSPAHSTASTGADGNGGRTKASRKKLSYLEQREYDAMESKILSAEAAAADAEAALAEPDVAGDHQKMAAACRALEAAHADVAALYARWEELERKIKDAAG